MKHNVNIKQFTKNQFILLLRTNSFVGKQNGE